MKPMAARSIDTWNDYQIVCCYEAVGPLVTGGGHAHAAPITNQIKGNANYRKVRKEGDTTNGNNWDNYDRQTLLDSLASYEIIEVTSSTHTLQKPPAKQVHLESWSPHDLKRPIQPQLHPHLHELSFEADQKQFQVQLTKNLQLFSPDYSESFQYWTEDGKRMKHLEPAVRTLSEVEHCFYQGTIQATGASTNNIGHAGINTCKHGFSGILLVQDATTKTKESYVIEPAHQHLDHAELTRHAARLEAATGVQIDGVDSYRKVNPYSLHVVYNMKHSREFATLMASQSSGCGVDNPEVETERLKMARPHHDGTSSTQPHLHTEAYVQDDHHRAYNLFKSHYGVQEDRSETSFHRPSSFPSKSSIPSQRYVELFVANDKLRHTSLLATTETVSASIVNIVSTHYAATTFSPAELAVTLIGQTTFFNADPWNITTGGCSAAAAGEMCVDKLLSTWNVWRANPENTAPYDGNDAGHLFSGYKFQSVVLGYAGVGSMCSAPQSGGIEQTTYTSPDSFNGVIVAHELGHNLGMQHDSNGNNCPASGYIMNAIVNAGSPPNDFSDCSKTYYTTWTNAGSGTCLNNVPTLHYGNPVCGNGYVEPGEACDCGTVPYNVNTVDPSYCNTTGNPCCDALSCQFIDGATCSNTDACCNNCQVVSAAAAKTCRVAANSCDLPEVCDGTTSSCPFDDNVGNGLTCTSGTVTGACYEGSCQSFTSQCTQINSVFTGGPWTPCIEQAGFNAKVGAGYCGNLYCTSAADAATYKQTGTLQCSQFDFSSAPQQMADGTPCGNVDDTTGLGDSSMLCYKGDCVSAETTNSRYQWYTTDWEKCSDCNTYQSRNVSCVRTSDGRASNDTLCSLAAKPASSQLCSDDELLCDHTIGGTITLTVFGNAIEVSGPVVIGTSCGIFFFFLILLQVCTACVAKKPEDAPKNKPKKKAHQHQHQHHHGEKRPSAAAPQFSNI